MKTQSPIRTATVSAVAVTILLLAAAAVAREEAPDAESPLQEPGGSCPRHLSDEPCFIDLETGVVTGPCMTAAGPPFYPSPPVVDDSNDDLWWEALVPVTLSDECSRVCVVLDYVEDPTGFTLDFGDSITNDGFGGNAGTGESEAELQILDDTLTLFSRSYGPGALDRVAKAKLQLENGSYKVCVSDQRATFGQPLSCAATPNGRALFALPDPFDGNSDLFIGLNRVISGPGSRIGTGLRRAYVTIE